MLFLFISTATVAITISITVAWIGSTYRNKEFSIVSLELYSLQLYIKWALLLHFTNETVTNESNQGDIMESNGGLLCFTLMFHKISGIKFE